MYRFSIIVLIVLFCAVRLQAQQTIYQDHLLPGLQIVPCLGFINPESDDINLSPSLVHQISENDGPDQEELLRLKANAAYARLKANKTDATNQTQTVSVPTPVLGKNFVGNADAGGCPQDNTLAVSKGGKVVCIVNSTINYYDITSGTYSSYTYSKSLNTFYNALGKIGVNSNLCDPKVIYDPVKDRFIMYTQTCVPNDTTSHIIISFSKTNNPAGGWYIYKISGNSNVVGKTGVNTWSDYPKMGISTNELFVTTNQFDNSLAYQGASIYELNKANGYSGSSMTMKYWSSVSGASHAISNSPFTLMPVSQGQGSSYGPGIWLLSSVSAPGGFYGSSLLKVYHITDDMTSTSQAIKYYAVTLPKSYFLGPTIPQKGDTAKLDNGDCRMQNGFYLNGIIHCVFTSMNGSGYNAINYSRIDVSSGTPGTVTNKVISDASNADLCYPAVASYSASSTDQTSVIAFVRSSGTLYPELDAVRVDDSMNVSNFITIKKGLHYNSYCYDNNHHAVRWGDYTGISYRPGQSNTDIWLTGSYGDWDGTYNYWSTYIAELYRNTSGIDEVTITPATNQKIAPNPVTDKFTYTFTLNEDKNLNITLMDAAGRLVNIMYHGPVLKGENVFTFNRGALANGIYFLRISDGLNIIGFEKIIVTR